MANKTMVRPTASTASSWWNERHKILTNLAKPARAKAKIKKIKAKKITKAKKPIKAKKTSKVKKVIKAKKATRAKKAKRSKR